ncbi:MAG: TolC family protein [Kiritimatiellae bacterium]|nr:TolC family protein [Kiritimatiellia bacterium]
MSPESQPHRPSYGAASIRAGVVRLARWGVCALLLSGCATVRRAREAQDTSHIPVGERPATPAETGLAPGAEVTLDEATRAAAMCHPSIARARQQVIAAEAQLRQAGAARAPEVSASAGYSRRTANTEAGDFSFHSNEGYTASLGLDLLVFDFGCTPAQVRAAAARCAAAVENLRSAENTVRYEVRSAFFQLGKARELRQVAEEAVRQYEENLEQVRAFVEVGRRTRYDVTKSEVDLGNARLELMDARNTEASAQATLATRIGLAEHPGWRAGEGRLEDVPGDVADWMAVARTMNPDLAALNAQETAASASVDEAVASLYPSFNLRLNADGSGDGFPLVWNASGALSSAVTLFDSRRRLSRIDEAAANLRSVRAQRAERESALHLELQRARSDRDTARERFELSDLILRQARESLALVSEQYRLGRASALEVTDAQVAVTRAQAGRVQAQYDWQAAVAQVLYTIGGEEAP